MGRRNKSGNDKFRACVAQEVKDGSQSSVLHYCSTPLARQQCVMRGHDENDDPRRDATWLTPPVGGRQPFDLLVDGAQRGGCGAGLQVEHGVELLHTQMQASERSTRSLRAAGS